MTLDNVPRNSIKYKIFSVQQIKNQEFIKMKHIFLAYSAINKCVKHSTKGFTYKHICSILSRIDTCDETLTNCILPNILARFSSQSLTFIKYSPQLTQKILRWKRTIHSYKDECKKFLKKHAKQDLKSLIRFLKNFQISTDMKEIKAAQIKYQDIQMYVKKILNLK